MIQSNLEAGKTENRSAGIPFSFLVSYLIPSSGDNKFDQHCSSCDASFSDMFFVAASSLVFS